MLRRTLIVATLVSMIVVLSFGAAFAAKPNRNDAPVVTAFDVDPASPSPVPILTFTATDSDGSVTGYLVTESSSEPSANDPGWSPTAPTSYTTASVGLVTLYAWARDDKDAVSASMSDTVDIPLPPIDADTLQGHPASDFAATIHTHNTADVNGLDASLAAKADQVDVLAALTTKADAVHSHYYGNMTVVATSGGEYTSPIDAVDDIANWCGIPSASNPCLIKIMPGFYDIGTDGLLLEPFVSIAGAGEKKTIVSGEVNAATPTDYFGHASYRVIQYQFAQNASVEDLTVEYRGCTNPADTRLIVVRNLLINKSKNFAVKNVTINSNAILDEDVAGLTTNADDGGDLTVENVTINRTGTLKANSYSAHFTGKNPSVVPAEIVIKNLNAVSASDSNDESLGIHFGIYANFRVYDSSIQAEKAAVVMSDHANTNHKVIYFNTILDASAGTPFYSLYPDATCVNVFDVDYNQITCQ